MSVIGAVPAAREALPAKEQALWLLQKFVPDVGVVNVAAAFRIGGGARWWPLQAALNRLIARHPALRTLYPEVSGVPERLVLGPDDDRARIELRTLPLASGQLAQTLGELTARPFDVEAELPLSAAHLIGAGDDVVLLVAHHLAVDVESMNVLLHELLAMYVCFSRGEELPAALAGEVPRYAEPPATDADREYWRGLLSDRIAAGTPSLAIGRAAGRQSFAGAVAGRQLSAPAQAALASLADSQPATRNIILLTAFALVLAWHSPGTDDVVVGLPVDARDAAHQDSVGYHVNMLAVPLDLAGATSFAEAVLRTRTAFLDGLSHSRAGVDEIFPGSYESTGRGTARRQPLFRYMFNYVDLDREWRPQGMAVELIDVERPTSRLDLELSAIETGDRTLVRCVYSTEAFDRADVEALIGRLDELMRQVGDGPDGPLRPELMWTAADRELAAGATLPPGLAEPETVPAGAIAILDDSGRPLPPGTRGQLRGHTAMIDFDGTVRLVGEARDQQLAGLADGDDTRDEPASQDSLVAFFVTQWRDLLDQPGIAGDANFFRYGGTSLKAVRLLATVRERYGVKLALRDVFRAPTPAKLANVLAQRTSEAGGD